MLAIPRSTEDFNISWLNDALAPHLGGDRIKACRVKDSDIPGQTAEIVLIAAEYEQGGAGLPPRLVAKVTSRNPVVLEQVIANYDQYRRETSFYREFPDCGIATPQCLYADHDPDTQSVVIVMGDLAPAESPSWAISPEQVELALSYLPGLHGKWWNDPLLRSRDWMVQYDNAAFFEAAFNAAHRAAGRLDELYDDPSLTQQCMAFAAENPDKMLGFYGTRPFTFVHGDYHAKQMFFPTEAGGEFAVIDWQFPFVAPGPWDFARMLGMCLATDLRRERESQLIDRYIGGLRAEGVTDYGREDFEIDYRMGLMASQMIMCVAAVDTDMAQMEKECESLGVDWRDVMFDRTQRAMADWDVLEFLRAL